MLNKAGFTLIEMLIVVSILLLVLALFPLMGFPTQTLLRNETAKIHTLLLKSQAVAMAQQKQIEITFLESGIKAGKEQYHYEHITCEGKTFHYTPQGTISQAQTITCTLSGKTQSIVLQLGSGAADVR